jgi:cytoskeletal protein CcmA (bactofilin family)
MAKYTSGRQKNLKVGISSYSENLTSLDVIGKVGIGTTNADGRSLYVIGNAEVSGILTAQRLYSGLYGEFTGGSISGTNIVGTSLSISGISTFTNGPVFIDGNLGIGTTNPTSKLWVNGDGYFSGVVTASNFYVDGGLIGASISLGELYIGGISTFYGGPVLIGTYNTTGTSGQKFQVDSGAYFSGNLGIGTTNPTSKLWVNGDGYFTGIVTSSGFYVGGQLIGGNISGTNIVGTALSISGISTVGFLTATDISVSGVVTATTFYGNLSGIASNAIYAESSGVSTSVIGGIGSITQFQVTGFSTFTNGPVLIGSTTSTGTALQLLQVSGGSYVSGNLGIGTTNPTSALTVTGDTYISGILTATDINSASDIRLKTNIKPFENALEKIVQINGVSFNWIENDAKSGGIIAQDVEKVFPELVNNGNHKTVNYNGLIGVLVESIKELKQEIEDLKLRLPEL